MGTIPVKKEVVIPITLSIADVKVLDNLRGELTRDSCIGLLLRVASCGGIASLNAETSETQNLRMQVGNLMLLLKKEMAVTNALKSDQNKSTEG